MDGSISATADNKPLCTAHISGGRLYAQFDPFRLSNTPARVRFLFPASGVAPSVPVRPLLVLRAVVGGPPWSAIVDGIPGQSGGTVVTAGQAFDVLRIRRVSRDTVVVQMADTTWSLTMKASP